MSNYWRETYGTRSDEFIEGVIAGIEAFAIWEDGQQYVGVMRTPLTTVIDEVKRQLKGDSK